MGAWVAISDRAFDVVCALNTCQPQVWRTPLHTTSHSRPRIARVARSLRPCTRATLPSHHRALVPSLWRLDRHGYVALVWLGAPPRFRCREQYLAEFGASGAGRGGTISISVVGAELFAQTSNDNETTNKYKVKDFESAVRLPISVKLKKHIRY